jgi:hypothetical protein
MGGPYHGGRSPADIVANAKERGRNRDIWETAQEILAKLKSQVED